MKGPLYQDMDYKKMKSKDALKEYLLNSEEDQFNLLAPKSYWAALILGLLLTASLFITSLKPVTVTFMKFSLLHSGAKLFLLGSHLLDIRFVIILLFDKFL